MLGVLIVVACMVFVDSFSVVTNVTQPESMLQKKHLGITFHFVGEAVTTGIIDAYHICSEENPANPLMKSVMLTEMKIIKEMFFHHRKERDK